MNRILVPLLLITWGLSACASSQGMSTLPTPSQPARLVAEGWQDLKIQTLCLEVQQSFSDTDPGFSLLIEPTLERLFQSLGINVNGHEEPCEAVLRLSLKGEALAEDYVVCFGGSACGHCYTGAQVSGELLLETSQRPALTREISAGKFPPPSISTCPENPEGAPWDEVWLRAVLEGLHDLWGPAVLNAALTDKEEWVRLVIVGLLDEKGQEGVPFLVIALQDPSSKIRLQAVLNLGELRGRAFEAVPALIETLDDSDRGVRSAAVGALENITGQQYGEDQGAWREWLVGPGSNPTPFTSWRGIPILPGSPIPRETPGFIEYETQASCSEVETFYMEKMPGAGWTFIEKKFPEVLIFENNGEEAWISLKEKTLPAEQSGCNVLIDN